MGVRTTYATEGFAPYPVRPDEGVRRLATAILVQAVRDIMPRKNSADEWKSWRQDALEWFYSEEVGAGSFLWVCNVLAARPDRIRSWLEKFLKSDAPSQKRMAASMLNFRFRA